jgi:short-subunit dehydrogenase involved in D-alanine esterification of teichoic acids
MSQATTQKIDKAAKEMRGLIDKSKRKLLELEVVLNAAEIKRGDYDVFNRAEDLIEKAKS